MNINNEPWRLGFWMRIKKRLAPLFDLTSWVLFVLTIAPLYFVAPAMVTTLVQWTAFAVALAGVTIVLSRIMAPMIDLGELYRLVVGSPQVISSSRLPAAILAGSLLIFMGLLLLALVLWASK